MILSTDKIKRSSYVARFQIHSYGRQNIRRLYEKRRIKENIGRAQEVDERSQEWREPIFCGADLKGVNLEEADLKLRGGASRRQFIRGQSY